MNLKWDQKNLKEGKELAGFWLLGKWLIEPGETNQLNEEYLSKTLKT